MAITLRTSAIGRVEQSLDVRTGRVITLPVYKDGKDTGIAIYVVESPFYHPDLATVGEVAKFVAEACDWKRIEED